MYLLLTRRVVKQATNPSNDKFAARSTNYETWHVSGPFEKRAIGERAMASALKTHTCLSAELLDETQCAARIQSDTSYYGASEHLRKALKVYTADDGASVGLQHE